MSALEELLQVLRTVEDQIGQAQRHLSQSRRSLNEATTALTRLDPDQPDTVVPPGLYRADDQIERVLASLDRIADTLRDYAARL